MTLNTTAGDELADSYVTIEEFTDHASSFGYNITNYDTNAIEQACRRGTRWIDATYGNRFIGKVANINQSLEWPRIEATRRETALDSATIPKQVKNATSEAIWRELTAPNSLSPDYVLANAIKQEQVGDLSVTYKDGTGSVDDVTPIIPIIDNLLNGLISAKERPALFGRCERA